MHCWHCEEEVNRYAKRCPYCSKDLAVQPEAKPTSKIAPLHALTANPFEIVSENEEAVSQEHPHFVSQAFFVILSLASLLAGSFFFFFGILIKLFSRDGVFTLEWSAVSWPYFVFSAILLVVVGLFTLSKIER